MANGLDTADVRVKSAHPALPLQGHESIPSDLPASPGKGNGRTGPDKALRGETTASAPRKEPHLHEMAAAFPEGSNGPSIIRAGQTTAVTLGSTATRQPQKSQEAPAVLNTGMAVTWLGTSSGSPTLRRNVSSIVLRLPHAALMVDAGEGTCKQILRAKLPPANIRHLFVTHMHGDHCFGIPGVLALVSAARMGQPLESAPFYISGPPGLHRVVHSALGYAKLELCMPLVVTEFSVDPRRHQGPTLVPDLPGGNVSFAVQAPDYSEDAAEAMRRWSEGSQRRRRTDQSSLHEVRSLHLAITCNASAEIRC